MDGGAGSNVESRLFNGSVAMCVYVFQRDGRVSFVVF